ncbi:hypothetical protein HK104_009689 [Borealophlyctis nickersoniae]|nr:hypothetical protein HK104_009689 [Borealophlyctis nickersoniae]
MSFKGLAKAVARLPTRVAQRAGYAGETVDQEYNELEARFKNLEQYAVRLHDDARKFKDSLSAMLAHEASFAETLVEVYQPVTTARYGPPPVRTSQEGINSGGEEAESPPPGPGLASSKETPHPKSLAAAQEFAKAMVSARELLYPDLDLIERRVVTPTREYLLLIDTVKRLMQKRERKLIDYDRHAQSVKKLRENTNRTASDERKLGAAETALDQATREFNNVNNLLKTQLPTFLALRVAFIDPCFQTLYWSQLKVIRTLAECFRDVAGKLGCDMRVSAMGGFEMKVDGMMDMLASLTLVKRPLRTGRSEEDEGYGASDTSPTEHAPGGYVGAGGSTTDSLPPYEEAGGASRISPGSFSAVHQSTAPPAVKGGVPIAGFAGPSGSTGSLGGKSGGPKYALALYDYDAQAEGDLSFKRDDKIEIVQKTPNADDWWTGRLRGKVGQFPGNYVTEL